MKKLFNSYFVLRISALYLCERNNLLLLLKALGALFRVSLLRFYFNNEIKTLSKVREKEVLFGESIRRDLLVINFQIY